MSAIPKPAGVGELLREWRKRRRVSQLELALEATVSSRHLSFVETGRSKPSRELLLHLAEQLEVPLRERNVLLLAGGYAPVYPETPLDAEEMLPVRHALQKIVDSHEPFPAVIVNRHWDLVWSNQPAQAMLTEGVAPELLAPRANAMRVSLHPEGLAPRIANLAQYSAHLLTRLQRQAALSADGELVALYDEVRAYPGVEQPSMTTVEPAELLFVPLRLQSVDLAEMSFFSTLATFGTAVDITLAELAIESFFPADKATNAALLERFG